MDFNLSIAVSLFVLGAIVLVLEKTKLIKKGGSIPIFLSIIVFIGLYFFKTISKFLSQIFGFSDNTYNLLFGDWGGGLIGFLPTALAIFLVGKYILKMNIDEQWNGTFRFTKIALKFGIISGLIITSLTLIIVVAMGQQIMPKIDFYRYGINMVTNLYEEIICRGLLLACCLKYWNKLGAIVWTSLIFALMHGIGDKAIFILLTSWIMAWAVLKAKNLWAGWISHQTVDMIVDTFLP
jgi:membrane protease YdiL (CAAX protease family)